MKVSRLGLILVVLAISFLTFFAPGVLSETQQRGARAAGQVPMYRLNFTLRIVQGASEQVRPYQLVLEDRRQGKIRALRKIPVRTGAEVRYFDIGVRCDAQFEEANGSVHLEVEMVYSDVSEDTAQSDTPEIHEWQSSVEATVTPNEETVLSSFDGGAGNRRYQFSVRAEKLR